MFISRYNRSEARVSSICLSLYFAHSDIEISKKIHVSFLKEGCHLWAESLKGSGSQPPFQTGANKVGIRPMCATCGEETSIEERDLVDLSCGIKTHNLLQWNLDVCSFFENVCQSFTFAAIAISAWLWTKGHPCFRKLGKLPQTSAPACTSQTPYNAYSFYKSTLILYVCS